MVEYFRNLPCYRLSLACGDSVLIALQGAQVLSWVSQGRERLFLSPNNKFDGHTPDSWRRANLFPPVQPTRSFASAWFRSHYGVGCA
jgi:hypothetical protein